VQNLSQPPAFPLDRLQLLARCVAQARDLYLRISFRKTAYRERYE
jgi:hypothetical protein